MERAVSQGESLPPIFSMSQNCSRQRSHDDCRPHEWSLAAWEILVPMVIVLNRLQSLDPGQKQTAGSRCQLTEQDCFHSESKLRVSGRVVFVLPSNTVYIACACMHTHILQHVQEGSCHYDARVSNWKSSWVRGRQGRRDFTQLRDKGTALLPRWCRPVRLGQAQYVLCLKIHAYSEPVILCLPPPREAAFCSLHKVCTNLCTSFCMHYCYLYYYYYVHNQGGIVIRMGKQQWKMEILATL